MKIYLILIMFVLFAIFTNATEIQVQKQGGNTIINFYEVNGTPLLWNLSGSNLVPADANNTLRLPPNTNCDKLNTTGDVITCSSDRTTTDPTSWNYINNQSIRENAYFRLENASNLNSSTSLWNISGLNIYPRDSRWLVGLGTINPLSLLHINDSSPTGAFRITNLSGDNILFVNASSKRVDIGTNTMTNISSDLGGAITPVQGSALYISYAGTGSDAFYIDSAGAATASGTVYRRSRCTFNAPCDVANGDQIGYTDFRGFSGDRFWQEVSIAGYVDGTFTSGNPPPTRLSFFTNLANGSTERMRIDRNGYIYMNTASQIAGLTDSILTVKQNVNKGDYTAVIQGATNNTGNSYGLRIQAGTTSGDIPLIILSNSTSSTFLRVNGNGYVGVGGNPSATFHVVDSTSIGAAVDISASGTAITNAAGLTIDNTQGTTNNYAGVLFGDNAASASGASAIMGVQLTDRTNHYGDYAFATRGTDGFLERMRITSIGKVGIGLTAPNEALEVIGNVRISGSLNASFINATKMMFIGTNQVQTEPPAFKIANGTALPFSNFRLENVSNFTNFPLSNFQLANVSNDTLRISGNASIALWNISSTSLLSFVYPRDSTFLIRLGNVSLNTTSNDTFALLGSASIYGSLNATFFNASQIMIGSNTIPVNGAFNLLNYSTEYSSTGYKISNFTKDYENQAYFKISNGSALSFSNFRLENVSNYSQFIKGVDFNLGNISNNTDRTNNSDIKIVNINVTNNAYVSQNKFIYLNVNLSNYIFFNGSCSKMVNQDTGNNISIC